MSETIKLPCGVTAELTFQPASEHDFLGPEWYAKVPGFMGVVSGDRDEALLKMDARCVEARAALLPPGAVVVEDTPETREKVAQGMWTHDNWSPHTLAEADASNLAKVRAGAEIYRDRAAAVLAALGVTK